ncbi:hypothetical protein IGI80_002205 [Enterococcus sp. DIV1420a]
MFQNCTSLTSLNVTSFDTSKVEDMTNMFRNCKSLTSLDLSSFNMMNVTDMTNIFRLDPLLTHLKLGMLSKFGELSSVTTDDGDFW